MRLNLTSNNSSVNRDVIKYCQSSFFKVSIISSVAPKVTLMLVRVLAEIGIFSDSGKFSHSFKYSKKLTIAHYELMNK